MTNDAAKQRCQEDGGHLADVKTQDLHNFLVSQIMKVDGSESHWIGLQYLSGEWRWSDGTAAVFTNWAPGEPNNPDQQCVNLRQPVGFRWDDNQCTKTKHFICQIGSVITCPIRYELFMGKCYRFSVDRKPYNESRATCHEEGGRLATVKNNETHNFLANHVRATTKAHTWIGLTDEATEGLWVWDYGTLLVGDGIWGTGEPNGGTRENCVHMYPKKDYLWNDSACPSSYYYICEI
ncbi:alpha-N-acetylgalactosamine-specific lectin-like [Branchiostoma floridae x Branchiostoma japonicum]